MKVVALLLVVCVASTTGGGHTDDIWDADKACEVYHFANMEKYDNPAERADNVKIEFIDPQRNYEILLKPEMSSSTDMAFEIKYGLYKYEKGVGSDDTTQTKGGTVIPSNSMWNTFPWTTIKTVVPNKPSGLVTNIPPNERPTAMITVRGVGYALPLQTILVAFPSDIKSKAPNSPYFAYLSLEFATPNYPAVAFHLMTNYYQSKGIRQDSNADLKKFVEAIKPNGSQHRSLPVDLIPLGLHSTMIQELTSSFTASDSKRIYYWKGFHEQPIPTYQRPMYIGLAPCPYTSLDIEEKYHSFVGRLQDENSNSVE